MANTDGYWEIRPGRKRFKVTVIKIVLFILGRALQCASRIDRRVKAEIADWPEGFAIMFMVLPNGPWMGLVKDGGGRLRYRGRSLAEDEADLIFFFKNVESAFLVLTAQLSTPQANAEHRVSVKGEIGKAMTLLRCLNVVQTYLYPKIIAKLAVKRVPHIPFFEKQINRLRIYLLGIPLGI